MEFIANKLQHNSEIQLLKDLHRKCKYNEIDLEEPQMDIRKGNHTLGWFG